MSCNQTNEYVRQCHDNSDVLPTSSAITSAPTGEREDSGLLRPDVDANGCRAAGIAWNDAVVLDLHNTTCELHRRNDIAARPGIIEPSFMLDAFGLSDPGCVRKNNEDYFISDQAAGIFVLADGMGGAKAGEYASQLSAESLYHFLLAAEPGENDDLLQRAFAQANLNVRDAARQHSELEGMGTTLIAARTLAGTDMQLASVGDSRAYLLSEGRLSLITSDQTWVAEVGSRLGLSPEALRTHPMRHVLTMAIGCADEVRVAIHSFPLMQHDQILLCSDGLHGVVDEQVISDTLFSEKTLEEKCHYLIEAAKQNGGPDNITVLLIRVV